MVALWKIKLFFISREQRDTAMDMKSNAAYGPVPSTEPQNEPQDYIYAEPNSAMDTYEEMKPVPAEEDTIYYWNMFLSFFLSSHNVFYHLHNSGKFLL